MYDYVISKYPTMDLRFKREKDEIQSDKYMKATRNYIKNNPGTNENQVKIDLAKRGICSELTTRRKIKDLLELGIIEDRKERNGFHQLYLCDRSEYNRIDKILDSMWLFGNMLDDPRVFRFSAECYEMVDLMLSILLYQTNNRNLSKNDSMILSREIVNLALKFKLQYFHDDETTKIVMVEGMQSHLKNLQKLTAYEGELKSGPTAEFVLDCLRECAENLKASLL
jgi:hypothetical protein